MRSRGGRIAVGLAATLLIAGRLSASPPGAPGPVFFNQRFVEAAHQPPRLDMERVERVFAYVFAALPRTATVYPTENYYYFSFYADGQYYCGNLRLAPEDRDSGSLHFAYFKYGHDDWWRYRRLGARDGVSVRRLRPLRYRVAFGGKAVVFQLNPLSQKPPRAFRPGPGEVFLGRSFDESRFPLLLLYNKERRHFLWVLDEERGARWKWEDLGDHLLLHPGSGFVFFRDPDNGRKLLVGVDAQNVEMNNYYDGPFDQLPDNFIAATPFAEYVQDAYPYTRGRLDRHGRFVGETRNRMAITPYREYVTLEELSDYVRSCLREAGPRSALYARLCRDDKAGARAEGGENAVATESLTGEVR